MASKEAVFKAEYTGAAVNDCSGYFKKVSTRLKLPDEQTMKGKNADQIIDHIAESWVSIGTGPGNGPLASDLAKKGYFVVALLKAKDHYPFKFNKQTKKYDIKHPYKHGHLAIVMPTPTSDYPYVICGSIAAEGKSNGTKKVYEKGAYSPWREIDAKNVQYYRTSTVIADPQ